MISRKMDVRLLGLLILLYPTVSYDYHKRPPKPKLRYVYYNGTYNVTKQQAARMYTFPTNLQPHAINASIELLLSQGKHLQNLTYQFDLVDTRTNIHELKQMDAVLFSLKLVLENEIKKLESKLKELEDLSLEEKLNPIEEISVVCLISSWSQMLNIVEQIQKDQHKIKGVKEHIDDMKRSIDLATVELRLYEHIQEERIEREKNKTRTTEE